MVIVEVKGSDKVHKYYMDGGVKKNFDAIRKFVEKDWDMCWIYSGYEGAGKSTMCFQHAKYLDPNFTIDQVCFAPADFEKKITTPGLLKRGSALVLDEGFVLNSRASMTEVNRRFLSILAECRQKNLYLFIVVPNFFDLDKNIALWRSRGLFYIYHAQMVRGYFRFFNYERKKHLYMSGRRFYNYRKTSHNLIGRFTKYFPMDEEDYKVRKLQAFETRQRNPKHEKQIAQRNIAWDLLNQKGVGWVEISQVYDEWGEECEPGMIETTVSRLRTRKKALKMDEKPPKQAVS